MIQGRILIVEDEAITAHSLQIRLAKMGYEVCGVVSSGEEAVATAQGTHPDLVLMDIHLRGEMDGIQAAELILAHDEIPIIYLTAHSDDTTVMRARQTAPQAYLVKPIDLNEMRISVEMALYRHSMERLMRESNRRYATILQTAMDGFWITDANGRLLDVNHAYCQMTGYEREELLSMTVADVEVFESPEQVAAHIKKIIETGTDRFETRHRCKDGRIVDLEISTNFLRDDGGRYFSFLRDISLRKEQERNEQAILALSMALRGTTSQEEALLVFQDQLTNTLAPDALAINLRDPVSGEAVITNASGFWSSMVGRRTPAGRGVAGYVYSTGNIFLSDNLPGEEVFYWRDMIGELQGIVCVPLKTQATTLGVASIGRTREITQNDIQMLTSAAEIAASTLQRAMLHEQMQRSLNRLGALHKIDQAINASMDLRITLDVILDQVMSELGVDGACILQFNAQGYTLESIGGRGSLATSGIYGRISLSEHLASQALIERNLVFVADLTHAAEETAYGAWLARQGFTSYHCAPLIAKGEVKGVLEVVHRHAFNASPEWLDFLNLIAGQAAIAIDNATLFSSLQRSNMELTLAYDTTLEGWARALELHDHKTEGHSQRVTDLTVQLAQMVGITGEALLHIRRGALLHDIGKMAIPDSILNKPGKLNDEEWKLMREHPKYALDFLESIPFLRPALDIPYCHQERWDGSGYPRGLRGEQIPLSARVFAVVDVWDALLSPRPYRSAWTVDQALQYIQEQAGKEFDPAAVEAFLKIILP